MIRKFLIEVEEQSEQQAEDELASAGTRIIQSLRSYGEDAEWECIREDYKHKKEKNVVRGKMTFLRR